MEFKKAEMVELHNSNVVIHTHNYSDGIIGWTDFAGENEVFYLDGGCLSTFLEMIGINITSVKTGKNKPMQMKSLEFPITRRKLAIGSGGDELDKHKIINLEVKIETPELIHIRFITQWEDSGMLRNYTQEVAYSGSYTVWWPYNQQNETECKKP